MVGLYAVGGGRQAGLVIDTGFIPRQWKDSSVHNSSKPACTVAEAGLLFKSIVIRLSLLLATLALRSPLCHTFPYTPGASYGDIF